MDRDVLGGPAVDAIALLGDPHRRRLYELVVSSDGPVGRDDAAAALGITRELAAFHLDRLVAGGLLTPEYRRRNGRSGPGAGRPAKLYRRADAEFVVSLPGRRYGAAAAMFADALDHMDDRRGSSAVNAAAHAAGLRVGEEARGGQRAQPPADRPGTALLAVLAEAGFEPRVDRDRGSVTLANCPYRDLTDSHRELTCGMNLAWAQGVSEGLGDPDLTAELAPAPGRCCVTFHDRRSQEG